MECASLFKAFDMIPDPRIDRTKLHKMSDVLIMTCVSVMCGADDYEDIHETSHALEGWFTSLLKLKNGIPSISTFKRVIDMTPPKLLSELFVDWINRVAHSGFFEEGMVVAIDGKRVKGSYDKASDKSAIHLLNAYCCDAGVFLGHLDVDRKTNEITAVPKMLEMLRVKGCIVTLDAMGCQREICKLIVEEHEAEFVIGLKGNQGNIYEEVKEYFDLNSLPQAQTFSTTDGGHGRIEERNYTAIDSSYIMGLYDWPGVQSVALVESLTTNKLSGISSSEKRFYMSSLNSNKVDQIANAIRKHWGVESFHWILDNEMDEDSSRIRNDFGAENMSLIRKIALNLLRPLDVGKKRASIKTKRFRCLTNDTIREEALGFNY